MQTKRINILPEMQELLSDLAGPEFYGRLDIVCKNGEVCLVRKRQTIKPGKKLTDTNYSGTISIQYEAGKIVHAEKIETIEVT